MKQPVTVSAVCAAAFVVFLFIGCAQADAPVARTSGPRYVLPEAGDGIALSSALQTPIAIRERTGTQNLKVMLSNDFVVSQVVDINLDIDQMEEQIIVYKRRDDPEDRIRLLVVDFDNVRNTYVPTWEGVTRANNVRTFVLSVMDVIGDHTMEIVAVGMNNSGRQTFDLFRQEPAPAGIGLFYRNIASFVTDASVEIEESDRSPGYASMQSSGQSFPVAVYQRNLETGNPLDLLKTTYHWRSDQGSYVKTLEEEIPGIRIEEAQLTALFEGATDDFERFLSGPWYRSTATGATGGPGELAYFNPDSRRMVFSRGESQEAYNWLNSYKTIYRSGPGLWINLHSEAVETVRKQAAVSVTSIDSISVTIEGNDVWNGTYRRLTPALQRAMMAGGTDTTRASQISLSGLYRNESGVEILFSSSRFTLREDGTERTGGYAVYRAGSHVLDLKFLDSNGLITEGRTYQIEHNERIDEDRIVRTLRMTPARVRSSGVEPVSSRSITLEQIVETRTDPEV